MQTTDTRRGTITVETGEDGTLTLKAKAEVCPRCQGKGTHDCWEGGMTRDEMDEQGPEFFEDYMSGVYDKVCSVCNGDRVVWVPDRENNPSHLLKAYDQAEQEDMEYEAAMRREMQIEYGLH